jgi:hypothetical protein
MAWFWTDDLARALVDAGVTERSSVETWLDRPTALAAPEGADPLELGRRELGLPGGERQEVA